MNTNGDGGPAFPATYSADDNVKSGASLRDYFATHMQLDVASKVSQMTYDELARLVGRAVPDVVREPARYMRFIAEARARLRFIEADAMLEARK